ncbi:MAG: DUF2950 family protein [Candidatus Sulfotelmatobacter sp.]
MCTQKNNLPWLDRTGIAAIILFMIGAFPFSFGQSSGQKTFASPSEASRALYLAIKNNDEQTMLAILGGDKELASTGNDDRDKTEREQFVQKYQEMHRLVHELDGATVLYLGAENWPFPLPLASKVGQWYFDSDAGKDEILFRTVGDDEATAVRVCRAVEATKKAPDGDVAESVQAIINGKMSPVGPLQGYYFRRLNGDSPAADGGSYIAYPAEYRVSGVMTFVVTPNQVVYERDLGSNTANVAASMTNWKPESGWRVLNPFR